MKEADKENYLAKINEFLGKWGPFIAAFGVMIAVMQYYNQDLSANKTVKITSCLNWRTAKHFSLGPAENENVLARYLTEVYTNDMDRAVNYLSRHGDKSSVLTMIHNMSFVNKQLDQGQFYKPFVVTISGNSEATRYEKEYLANIASTSRTIFSNLEQFGINKYSCTDLTPINF
ncbi:MAG: hypothetical protein WC250_02580 [Candidatus Paceibacterota bacterium]|jgi:hypothetical protein